MSPSSSAQPLTESTGKNRSRHNSLQDPSNTASKPSKPSSRPGSPGFPVQTSAQNSPHYTVFIRLPFKRGDFQDPPPVEWDSSKDRKLWKLISSGKGELNWEGLSHDFGVDLSFLLMQAAWLSERHMERIRKQVGRISGGGVVGEGTGSTTASAVGGLKVDAASKAPPLFAGTGNETSSPGTSTPQPSRMGISRTPSTTTVTQSKITGSTTTASHRRQGSSRRLHPVSTSAAGQSHSPKDTTLDSSSSDSEEDQPRSAIARSQAFRRPPLASMRSNTARSKQKPSTLASDGDEEESLDDEENDSGEGYLPFAASTRTSSNQPSSAAQPTSQPSTTHPPAPSRQQTNTTTSSQSSSSTAPHPSRPQRQAALSPKHRAAHLVSSETGSPSMGSSFSDLEDSSLTQSALEEALMSNMRAQGGSTMTIGSRMSSIRDALSSRRNYGQGQGQGGQ